MKRQPKIPARLGEGHRAFRMRGQRRGISAATVRAINVAILAPSDFSDPAAAPRHAATRRAFIAARRAQARAESRLSLQASAAIPSARDAALDVIAALPLTEDEWLGVFGLATMLRLGGISIEGARAVLSEAPETGTVPLVRPPAAGGGVVSAADDYADPATAKRLREARDAFIRARCVNRDQAQPVVEEPPLRLPTPLSLRLCDDDASEQGEDREATTPRIGLPGGSAAMRPIRDGQS